MNFREQWLLLTILVALIINVSVYAEEGHTCSAHFDWGIELGLSIGYAQLEEDNEHHEEDGHLDHDEDHDEDEISDDGMILHIHVGKTLKEEGLLSHLSLGVAGEMILAEHEHYSLFGYASINPWHGLVLSIGPGIEWAKHEDEWSSKYSTHLETLYVFDIGAWHIGPVVEYSWTDSSDHLSAGIHFGIHL